MNTKKYKLKDLKVKSYISEVNEVEQKTSKGGFYFIDNFQRIDFSFKRFTEHKTQLFEATPQRLNIIKPTLGGGKD